MNTPETRPSVGSGSDAHYPSVGRNTLRIAVELSAIIAVCVVLIAAVDGFGG